MEQLLDLVPHIRKNHFGQGSPERYILLYASVPSIQRKAGIHHHGYILNPNLSQMWPQSSTMVLYQDEKASNFWPQAKRPPTVLVRRGYYWGSDNFNKNAFRWKLCYKVVKGYFKINKQVRSLGSSNVVRLFGCDKTQDFGHSDRQDEDGKNIRNYASNYFECKVTE